MVKTPNSNAHSNHVLKISFFPKGNVLEKIFWVTIVVLGLIAASLLLTEAVDEWVNNPTGTLIRLLIKFDKCLRVEISGMYRVIHLVRHWVGST